MTEKKPGILAGSAGGSEVKNSAVFSPFSLSRKDSYLLWEKTSRDKIEFKRIYVDITNDLVAALLLSQIIYWHLTNRERKSRLTIERDGKQWLAKSREDWWNECRITPRPYDRAIAILEKKGIVVTALYKFAGVPTKHVSLNWDAYLDLVEKVLGTQMIREENNKDTGEQDRSQSLYSSDFNKSVKSISHGGEVHFTENVKSYIRNTETTADITDNIKNSTEENETYAPATIIRSGKVSEKTFPSSFDYHPEKKSSKTGIDKTPEVQGKEKYPESLSPTGIPIGDNSGTSKSAQSEILALRDRYGPQQIEIMDQAMDAFASTRKTYTMSPSIVLNQLRRWAKIPPAQVIEGLTIYLEKDYAAQGKAEDYALAIIINVTKQKHYGKKEKGHAPKLSGEFTDSKYAHLYILPKDLKPTGL